MPFARLDPRIHDPGRVSRSPRSRAGDVGCGQPVLDAVVPCMAWRVVRGSSSGCPVRRGRPPTPGNHQRGEAPGFGSRSGSDGRAARRGEVSRRVATVRLVEPVEVSLRWSGEHSGGFLSGRSVSCIGKLCFWVSPESSRFPGSWRSRRPAQRRPFRRPATSSVTSWPRRSVFSRRRRRWSARSPRFSGIPPACRFPAAVGARSASRPAASARAASAPAA